MAGCAADRWGPRVSVEIKRKKVGIFAPVRFEPRISVGSGSNRATAVMIRSCPTTGCSEVIMWLGLLTKLNQRGATPASGGGTRRRHPCSGGATRE
jgi:hypothetical protein